MAELMMKMQGAMLPMVIAALAIASLGVLLSLIGLIAKKTFGKLNSILSKTVFGFGIIFIVMHFAGYFSGFSPSFPVGDDMAKVVQDPDKYSNFPVFFWQVGVILLVAWLIAKGLTKLSAKRAA